MPDLQLYTTTEVVLITATVIAIPASIILALGLVLVVPEENKLSSSKRKKIGYNLKQEEEKDDEEDKNNDDEKEEEEETFYGANSFRRNLSSVKNIEKFPYLVSVTMPLWSDEPKSKERLFQCAGIILSDNFVLTSRCGIKASDWTYALIRAGSDYWSIEGTLHHVISKVQLKDFTIVNVKEKFQFNEVTIKKANFKMQVRNWKEATAIGWFGIKSQQKYAVFNETLVNRHEIQYKKCNLTDIKYCDAKFNDGHVLVHDGEIMMMKIGGCDKQPTNATYFCGFKYIDEDILEKLVNVKKYNTLWIIK